MRKYVPFTLLMVAILIPLIALYVHFGQLKNENEEALAGLKGNVEHVRMLRTELAEYQLVNSRQQTGVLIVGGVVILIAGVWLVAKLRRERD